jgi:hypothetical protein
VAVAASCDDFIARENMPKNRALTDRGDKDYHFALPYRSRDFALSVFTRSQVLDIPEAYRPGLAALASLPANSFDELFAALQRAPQAANRKELGAWITPEVKSVTATDVPKIVNSITSLYRVRLRMEISADKLARDVVDAMQKLDIPELRIDEGNRQVITDRVAKLVALESLNVTETKAQELKAEYEHSFCDSRIFTDLRPVFSGNVADSPNAMLIVYTLRLGYHDSQESRHREFHVALDSSDLAALKDAIVRAETKAATLKSQLAGASIKPLEI